MTEHRLCAALAEADGADASAVLRGRRVLIVEDELLIVLMLEDMLCGLGCDVAGVAATSEAALAALEGGPPPDAVVLDLSLDGRPSDTVADALAARGVPFLIVTGYSGDSLPTAHGRRPVLGKPFLEEDLGRALAEVLGGAGPAPAVAA